VRHSPLSYSLTLAPKGRKRRGDGGRGETNHDRGGKRGERGGEKKWQAANALLLFSHLYNSAIAHKDGEGERKKGREIENDTLMGGEEKKKGRGRGGLIPSPLSFTFTHYCY